MSFNKPTRSEHQSVQAFIFNSDPIDQKESAYLDYKEDLVTLRPGREYAWLDTVIEKALRILRCRLVEVRIKQVSYVEIVTDCPSAYLLL